MNKIVKAQSGPFLFEMVEAEFEKVKFSSATNTDDFMTVRVTVKD